MNMKTGGRTRQSQKMKDAGRTEPVQLELDIEPTGTVQKEDLKEQQMDYEQSAGNLNQPESEIEHNRR